MVCLVCLHGPGVYFQYGMEYMGSDSKAEQSCFRLDRFRPSFTLFMGCDCSYRHFLTTDLADGFKRFVLSFAFPVKADPHALPLRSRGILNKLQQDRTFTA